MPVLQYDRDWTASLRDLAQKICIGVNTFGPLIEKNWGSTPQVLAALEWARGACSIVPQLDQAFASVPESDPSPEDPTLWPGVNPDKPSAPDPNFEA